MYYTIGNDNTFWNLGFNGKRDIHIGVDIGGSVGLPVRAIADGEITHCGYNAAQGDYGHVIVTEHELILPGGDRRIFYALYGWACGLVTATYSFAWNFYIVSLIIGILVQKACQTGYRTRRFQRGKSLGI